MFVSEALKTHLETAATIRLNSLVISEWNMNMPDNIFKTGNYRYRPTTPGSQYYTLPNSFDQLDSGNYYTNALNSDITINAGLDNDNNPQQFTLSKDKVKMIYSLEDCLKPFRPRSGINKPSYFAGRYLSNSGTNIAQRPRYYMPSRYDQFKYWTSYRTENNFERGIANKISNSLYYIEDSAPFVVYKNEVPANRIVVKMQTNVGEVDLGPFTGAAGTSQDPLYGDTNKTTPVRWKIQYLKNNNWIDAYSFNENSIRLDGSGIIKSDGYVEIQYGLIIPENYSSFFRFAETLSSESMLPEKSELGYSYLVIENDGEKGTFYIWTGEAYETFIPEYGWSVLDETINQNTRFVTDFTANQNFIDDINGDLKYREFQYIKGIRIVVETMNKFDSTFDLIEMSPRLTGNISDKVISFGLSKSLSDTGNSVLPVSGLLASTGNISIFDDDQAFNENNSNSIISDYIRKNIKFVFYEIIQDVDGYDYYIPIKTMYSEGVPQADNSGITLSINLRDFYFYLESMPAPRLLLTEASLSFAITTLLDYIGFSNYSFKRTINESDPVIPYFFVAPDQNVAEVLNQLAIATQSAMFFDEYNNFVMMTKNYLLPDENVRGIDFVLSGSNNQETDGIIKNSSIGNLPNIISISSQDKKVYNDGKINYTTRYIQRSYGSIRQSSMIDQDKTWIYKPALLWEVSGDDATKTINSVASKQGKYVLGAMPLNSPLTSDLPIVVNNIVTNNIIDLGENIHWLTRYQGYLYANGEIIRYDAAQFNITGTGNVWISSNQEYQKYFSSLPFNGKIYPTGLIRIYSEPYYETIDSNSRIQNGSVYKHGRGQFGTQVTSHNSGIPEYWSDNTYARACQMKTEYLFTTKLDEDINAPATELGSAGVLKGFERQSSRTGVIKNFLSTSYLTETQINNLKTTQTGTIQSSALVFNGPTFTNTENPLEYISYVYKNLGGNDVYPQAIGYSPAYPTKYRHFGTRLRIVGKIENNENRVQTPTGATTYYQVSGAQPNQNTTIGGGSGGISIMLDPATNVGYYFEIVALTEKNVESYLRTNAQGASEISLNNIVFYKIMKKQGSTEAIPVKLWGGLTNVLVDDGRFTGQYRMTGEENPTVYDLAIEYQDIGNIRRFYLYINNKLIRVVDDKNPLPVYNNMALFVRGSSRVMFENIYALAENYSQNTVSTVGQTLSSAFGDKEIDSSESFRKYAMSGIIQSTYLNGLSSQQPPKYNMYFEEFGTIMRECAYFDIRYDRAYPALYAKISPTFNRIKGYTVSGFQADSYGAEFLIFNATDTALNLDETTGNYLKIQGITFTQDTTYELTVDEYFKNIGNLSDPQFEGNTTIVSSLVEKQKYDEIKLSRLIYGKNEFSLDSIYIQSKDDAENLMGWIINKTMKPKKLIGANIFAIPTLQLGDIVTVDYKDTNNMNMVVSETTRFLVYNIEYRKDISGPSMTVYLSEV